MNDLNEELEIQRIVDLAKAAKEEAKDLRDDGDVPGAIRVLLDTLAQMDQSPLAAKLESDRPSAPVKRLAGQLADCLGMLGGNYRRIGELERARQTFGRGRIYEESSRLGVNASYNLVNSITLPLESGAATPSDLTADLRGAVEALERQVEGNRRTDRWAWADLAECRLLLGELDQALKDYERVRDLGDDDTLRSVVTVLARLEEALKSSDPSVASHLSDAIAALSS
jgi:tetratricopeptide (TPR) repeat protein